MPAELSRSRAAIAGRDGTRVQDERGHETDAGAARHQRGPSPLPRPITNTWCPAVSAIVIWRSEPVRCNVGEQSLWLRRKDAMKHTACTGIAEMPGGGHAGGREGCMGDRWHSGGVLVLPFQLSHRRCNLQDRWAGLKG